jgi:hypothetical protein
MASASAAKRVELKLRNRRKARKRARTAPQIATLRLNDLARLFRARYGITLPNDDAGRDDLFVALSHLSMLSRSRERMARYLEIWAPWLTVAEARQTIDHALTEPQRWKADQLAWRMRLTAADRATLGITTIGAVDLNKAGRTRLRKRKARDRERARRLRLKAACAP